MVPSVVYGLWGLEILAPLVLTHIAPFLERVLGFIPFFSGAATSGYGLLTAGLVLAIMVLPVITSTLVEALKRVPNELREASFGLDADPKLQRIAGAVHYLDVGGIPVAEAAGLEAVLGGLREVHADDDRLVLAASAVFDALYAAPGASS